MAEYINPQWRLPNEKTGNNQDYSMSFDGSSRIEIPSSTSFIYGNNDFSFSAWIYKTGTSDKAIFSKGASGNGNHFLLFFSSNNTLRTDFYNSASTGDFSYSFSNNQWYHIVVTRTGSGNVTLYVNGGSGQTITPTYADGNISNSTSFIGSYYSSSSFNWLGQINDVAIFNYALPATGSNSIATLYNSGTPFNPMALSSPPVAYYPLGNSAHMGSNYLTPNGALQDYVFDFNSNSPYTGSIDTNFTLPNWSDYSYSFWIRNTGNTYSQDQYILGNGNASVGSYKSYRGSVRINNAKKIRIFGGDDVNYYLKQYDFLPTNQQGNTLIFDGKWYNVVITFTSGAIALYVNGVVQTHESTGTIGTPITGFAAGNSYFIGQSGMPGGYSRYLELSNVQIFNTVLSQPNAETLYNYGSPIQTLANIPQNSNLKAWYKLDASEIYDSSNTQWQIANNVLSDKAYSFNGTNNIEITQNSSIQTSNFSIGLWIKGYPQSGKTIIENGGANGFSIKTYSTEPAAVRIITGGTNGLKITGALNGEWNFVWFTWDGVSSRGGLNGGYNYSGGSVTNYDSSKGLFIGSDSSSLNGFVGEIAQVVYYDGRGNNNATGTYGTVPTNPPASTSWTANLVSWWKLDTASITDSNGSNNGTNNGATLIDTNVGRPAGIGGLSSGMSQANLVQSDLLTTTSYSPYALAFNGSLDYIDLNSDITLTGNKSVSFWVNFTSSIYAVVFGGASSNYYPFIDATYIHIRAGGTASSFAHGGITAGVWYHICVTGDGTNATAYLNGSSLGTQTDRGFTFKLINGEGAGYYGVDGKLSNCAIWNTVLTSSEVTEIYNEGLPSNLHNFSGTAPVAWWQLGSNSSWTSPAWTVLDEIGSNDGTSNSMLENALTNGVGTSGNGTSTNMSLANNISGSSPSGEGNSLSVNMTLANIAGGVN